MNKTGRKKGWVTKSKLHPDGENRKLRSELGVDHGRAQTIKKMSRGTRHAIETIYDHPGSKRHGR